MAIYIGLHNFTDEGIRNIEQTISRAEEFEAMARDHGVTVKDIYWTQSDYDVVSIVEGGDEAVAALYLKLRKKGHLKGKSMRAFSPAEMTSMLVGF